MKEKEQLFLDIFESHNDDIFRFIVFRVSDRDTALDLTQECFAKFWEILINEKDINNPKAFLYQIARNKIIDHYRKKKSLSLDELTEKGFDVSGDDNIKEIIDDLKNLLSEINNLPEKYKEILTLHIESELDANEISEVLGISKNLASVRLHRAKEALKKKYNDKFI